MKIYWNDPDLPELDAKKALRSRAGTPRRRKTYLTTFRGIEPCKETKILGYLSAETAKSECNWEYGELAVVAYERATFVCLPDPAPLFAGLCLWI